jgi:hypothetical protein
MSDKYYNTKWDNLSKEEKYSLAEKQENELANFLIQKCNFKQVIPTRDSIITIAKGKALILPDLMGIHNNSIEYFIELKHKNRRMKFNDNGIDYDKAEAYLKVQEQFNKKVLIVFKDDEQEWKSNFPYVNSWFKDDFDKCTYYGNWIDKLHFETPENNITITYGIGGKKVKCFPLKNMKKVEDIFKERQSNLNFEVIQ